MLCFHVGCTTGYSKNYTKCHLFKLKNSASEDIKRQWITAYLKENTLSLTLIEVHCDLHFDSKFITKHYVINYGDRADRVEIQGERKNWTLTNDAVPTIFENQFSPIYNRPLLKRKAPTERSVIRKKNFLKWSLTIQVTAKQSRKSPAPHFRFAMILRKSNFLISGIS